jgi:hypothetical protein
MSDPNEPLSPEPEPHCDHTARRVIRLRWPYAEAIVVRARLVTDTGGQFDVSPLYRADAGWAFSICRECAKREAVALATLLLVLAVP